MKRDAEEHSKEDKERREEIDLRNTADQIIYQTEKQFEEMGDKVDTALKDKITKMVDDIKSAKDSNDMNKLKESIDILNKEWAKLSQDMYSKSSQEKTESSDNPDASNDKKGENIEDADFEVVDK